MIVETVGSCSACAEVDKFDNRLTPQMNVIGNKISIRHLSKLGAIFKMAA